MMPVEIGEHAVHIDKKLHGHVLQAGRGAKGYQGSPPRPLHVLSVPRPVSASLSPAVAHIASAGEANGSRTGSGLILARIAFKGLNALGHQVAVAIN